MDPGKIHHNARTLVTRLRDRGISVTGVTKATLGSPGIVDAWLHAGIDGLGDSRIENLEKIRQTEAPTSLTLIRSPMLSQAERVVAHTDVSFNTELDVMSALSSAAKKQDRIHGIVLMIELGDLREGIMPALIEKTVLEVLRFPNLSFKGIGTNLACRCGVSPDGTNMGTLSTLADSIEATFGITVETVSGGNSANLTWALSGADTGRVNDLRLGEALLLGVEPLHRNPIEGLHTDAITLVAEVIESKRKPSQPWGEIAESAFGEAESSADRGTISQSILAIGRQDTDPDGLEPPTGLKILAASSDHLVIDSGNDQEPLRVGSEVSFQLNYSALLRAMTSPFISKEMQF
ncbi:MAG: alanine/ornithine racemase family PLP-dependent enzyme [Verrucomicrobiales bacterium]|nr:alanine/ornithine racemase family PLP-dependent enzyme [Verrucomicrobiales bacterium]